MYYRQVHLDFHTSPYIPDIGAYFDKETFANAFKNAHVNSVNLFAKCHHGYSYYPTEVGTMHPNLSFDLLGSQIDALQSKGIRTAIYISAVWDELAASQHPEWCSIGENGILSGAIRRASSNCEWAELDLASPYLDYLCAQIEEIMQRYPNGDGTFVDICFQNISFSQVRRRRMAEQGMDWQNPDDMQEFNRQVVEEFYDRVHTIVNKYQAKCPLFFNEGHIRRGMQEHYKKYFTHLEIESLPTAGWGYDHFPLSARYAEQTGMEFLGMTGKFHLTWGEVGGYKKPEALIYECGAMLAHGAACCIGDHLHPTGMIDSSTMRAIGAAYNWVEKREKWAVATSNRAEIAFLSLEAYKPQTMGARPEMANAAIDEGVVRILLEGQFTFNVIDLESNFADYQLLILADEVQVNSQLKEKIDTYVTNGGRVLCTGKSGLDKDGFIWDIGAEWRGVSSMSQGDYLLPIPELCADKVNNPLFMYQPSQQIVVTDGKNLGDIYDPYMNREPYKFSGHVNAPHKPQPTGFHAGTQKGAFTYLASPIFGAYRRVGSVAMLEIAEKLILMALGQEKMLQTSLPRAGRATVRQQPENNRDIVHLLYANPILRGNIRGHNVEPIQDIVPLHDIHVSVQARKNIHSVRLVPEGSELIYNRGPHYVDFTVPEIKGHCMVEINYQP